MKATPESWPVIYRTDRLNYTSPDSGCALASRFLGKRSVCQACPFSECTLLMSNDERNKLVYQIYFGQPLHLS